MLEKISYGTKGCMVIIYTTFPWETLSETVSCLQIERRKKQAK